MKIFIIKNLKYISLFCTIAVMVAIFLFSAQSAQQSSKLSGRIVTVVLRIVMPNYDKLPLLERQKIINLFLISIFSWIMGTFYAVTDEIHQMFVTARYSSFTDVLIDSSGVIFGILFFVFLFKFYFSKSLFIKG